MPAAKIYLRYLLVALVAMGVGGVLAATLWLKLSPSGQALRAALAERTGQEWIRYTLRRLEGHNKLEWVAHPVLHHLQQQLEREPPPDLPTLGKGQQSSPLPAVPGMFTEEVEVATPEQLQRALRDAQPGTRIWIQPGTYVLKRKLQLGHGGESGKPIVLGARVPGTVWLAFSQPEGIVVDKPHWVFENLGMRGACARHDQCEHALHVVGAATHTVIRNNTLVDFNAHIKVNGLRGEWPDHGLMAFNTLTNTRARETDKPVVPLDLVAASHWRVEDNLVSHFVKRGGNRISYGMFMKGAGEGGRFERNLVICSLRDVSAPGVRVGLSFGGGGTGGPFCRDGSCATHEHHQGRAVNNIVAHCNDTGIDVNRSTGIELLHNTLVNTSGIATRGTGSRARAQGNVLDGRVVARDGSELIQPHHPALRPAALYRDADALNFEWVNRPAPVPGLELPADDFLGQSRLGTANQSSSRDSIGNSTTRSISAATPGAIR